MISDPGALISTHVPKLEYEARESIAVVAPTVMAFTADAGDLVHALVRSFPAATTTVIPALTSLSTASFKELDLLPPILKLRTACVFGFGLEGERIQSRAAITPEYEPLPEQFNKRIGTIVAFFAIPYLVPAAVVATCVPCPLQSRVPRPSLNPEKPEGEIRPSKSSCSNTPVSPI